MKKVVTAHNYVRTAFSPTKPGLTVPGQILPIRTILERFRRGQSVQSFAPVYNPDVPPGYENLDPIERIEAARAQANKVAAMRRSLAKKAAEATEQPVASEPPIQPVAQPVVPEPPMQP